MTHLPPPIPTPGRLLPVRRRVLPARSPRLWLPRWPALSPSKWRRPDARAMAWGFKAGHPLFKAGLWCYTCCGGTCADLSTSPVCSNCTGGTPRLARVIFSGVTPGCAVATTFPSNTTDQLATNPNGITFDTAASGSCVWSYGEGSYLVTPATTLNFRHFNNGACTGTPATDFMPFQVLVDLQDQTAQGRGVVVRASLAHSAGGGTVAKGAFYGQASFTACTGTYTMTNDTYFNGASAVHPGVGSGGTCTVQFCP